MTQRGYTPLDRLQSQIAMPETLPEAPPAEPEVEPDTLPVEEPARRGQPSPFDPDWPDDFPMPPPKA